MRLTHLLIDPFPAIICKRTWLLFELDKKFTLTYFPLQNSKILLFFNNRKNNKKK